MDLSLTVDELQRNFLSKILTYLKQTRPRHLEIARDVHRGLGDSEHTNALSAHRGKNTTYEKILQDSFGITSRQMSRIMFEHVNNVKNKVI